jgi:hypothetical protein
MFTLYDVDSKENRRPRLEYEKSAKFNGFRVFDTRFETFVDRTLVWSQIGSDINGEAIGDSSGTSVSLNDIGDIVAIGAPFNDSGYTRVFKWDGSSWNQLGADIDGEVNGDQAGWSVNLNSSGDRIAIGARLNSGNGFFSGHTRIFGWNGAVWNQLGADIDGEGSLNLSGISVSLNSSGDRVAIGANLNRDNGFFSGHTRIFEWNGAVWNQLGVDIDGEAASDFSGISVSLNSSGDRVAIGANGNDGNGADSGHTRIFKWDGIAWIQLGVDIDGEASLDESGISVSLNSSGDRVAIGAHRNNGNGFESGHTRIFEWDGAVWIQLGTDIDGEAASDLSGYSVSLNNNGDRVAIGAYFNDGINGVDSGHTRIFEWDGAVWNQLGLDIDGEAAVDLSGYSVSLNGIGDKVAIGAQRNSENGLDSGHTRIFEYGL